MNVTITSSREITIERLAGSTEWSVMEFEDDRVLLSARRGGTQFQAHFDAEQWTKFQALIAGSES